MPTDKGANAGVKVASLVAGMAAETDSLDDMARLRHGGMGRVFTRAYAPSTPEQFLRAFSFGPVSQLGAVASRVLLKLAGLTPALLGVLSQRLGVIVRCTARTRVVVVSRGVAPSNPSHESGNRPICR